MDKMYINNLQLFANHGAIKEEKILGQLFELSLELDIDLKTAGKSDDLNESVNYADICEKTHEIFCENTYDLIETAASKVAVGILEEWDKIKAVKVSLRKPWAPIKMNLEAVGIVIERKWHRVYLSLGSNMGDRVKILEGAIRRLKALEGCKHVRESSMLETKPWGNEEQEDFMNSAVEMITYLEPYELLKEIHTIEDDYERVREIKWGPRTLDIDILLFDDIKIYEDDLIIPHPYMHERDFVLKPMVELAPGYIHPVYNKSMLELAKNIEL